MKQRKIAISLAVVAAIATPLVLGTYLADLSTTFVPFSKETEAEIRSVLAETNNCQTNLDSLRKVDTHDLFSGFDGRTDPFTCKYYLEIWQAGGGKDFSLSKYLALNAAAAAIAFTAIFGLSYLLPALARRYWRWLST